MTTEKALEISQALFKKGGKSEAALQAKCRWEAMPRIAVIKEWGDPRKWPISKGRII